MLDLGRVLDWFRSQRREQVVDRRQRALILADKLDALAQLMQDVLDVTDAHRDISIDRAPELERFRKRVWDRWVAILGETGYATADPELQSEIEQCIKIAHAAPGAYVEEVLLAQVGLAKGNVSTEVLGRFASAIDSLRDLTTRMRLRA